MAQPTITGFPSNVVETVKPQLLKFMPDHVVVARPVRFMDPERTIGIYVVDWTPLDSSHEIGREEPTLARYLYRVQNMVKAADEEYGKEIFAFDSKSVRVVLYRDTTLAVSLATLTDEALGTREVLKRWGVGKQRFLNTELQSQFTFVAQTDFWVETESIKL